MSRLLLITGRSSLAKANVHTMEPNLHTEASTISQAPDFSAHQVIDAAQQNEPDMTGASEPLPYFRETHATHTISAPQTTWEHTVTKPAAFDGVAIPWG